MQRRYVFVAFFFIIPHNFINLQLMMFLIQAFLILFILSRQGITALSPTAKNNSKSKNGIRPGLSSQCFAHTSAKEAGVSIEIASLVKGLGAFATKRIPIGTLLGKNGGETMTLPEVKARYWGKRVMDRNDKAWLESRRERGQAATGNYLIELPDQSFVDGEDADLSSWCRFMNHAKESTDDCNVKAFMQSTIGGEDHVYPHMFAIQDIEIGDELCWDYGDHFFIKGEFEE